MNNFTGNHFGLGLRSHFMKKFFVVLGILATILIATRPSASDHKEAVSNTLQEMVNEEILSGADSTSNILSDSFSMLATTFCGAVIQIVTSHLMTVDDYWICSVGKIKMGEKRKRFRLVFLATSLLLTRKPSLKRLKKILINKSGSFSF